MGQAQINVRTRACSGTFIARTKQAALTHNVRGKRITDSNCSQLMTAKYDNNSFNILNLSHNEVLYFQT